MIEYTREDRLRERFEKWISDRGMTVRKTDDGKYFDLLVEERWGAWLKASNDLLSDISEWLSDQRNDYPCTGFEFANSLRKCFLNKY